MIKSAANSDHRVEFHSGAAEGGLVARCSCGWEQATHGWMLESAEEEVRRLATGHLAEAAGKHPVTSDAGANGNTGT
jgi:hypothetical protein